MDCLQIRAWGGDLERTERPRPSPGDGEVLVEVEATSVGLTVANVINGDLGSERNALPRIPGHEIVGNVVETGAGVETPSVEDFVGAYFYLSCDSCEACRRGRESLCTRSEGYVSVDVDGGFAEYVALPADNALPIPSTIDPVVATAIPDAIATPYHVMNQRANVNPGDRVLILGAGGGVGIHLVQMAQHFGTAVTAVDQSAEKLDACERVGADRVIDATETQLDDALEDRDVEYDAIVDFTGVTDLIEASLDHLAPRGRLVNLTTFPGRSMETTPREHVLGELEIVGSRYCSKYELIRSGQLVAENVIEPVVTEVVDLEGVPELLDRIRSGDVVGRGAVAL